jgi:iron complex transport system substrate-binding protein
MFKKFVFCFILLSALIISCYKKQPAVKETIPHRIISLGPYITEMIYLLGKEDNLIANTIFCERPEAARKKEKIGSLIEINIEKIISLKPDLVFAGGLTHPKNIKKIKDLGIRVIIIPTPKSYEEICGQFLLMGRILGADEIAKKTVEDSNNIVDKIKSAAFKLKPKKVFMQIGANPLWSVNKHSYLNDFIEFSNAINISKDSPSGIYSKEKVVEQNPDIILITAMGINDEIEKNNWLQFKSINASINNLIFKLDSNEVCSANPVTFAVSLAKIVKLIHPEIILE